MHGRLPPAAAITDVGRGAGGTRPLRRGPAGREPRVPARARLLRSGDLPRDGRRRDQLAGLPAADGLPLVAILLGPLPGVAGAGPDRRRAAGLDHAAAAA